MNEYQKLLATVEDRGLTIERSHYTDAQSGWGLADIYIRDGKEVVYKFRDCGPGGYSGSVKNAMKAIERHFAFKKVKDFDSFVKYIDEQSEGGKK